MEEKKKTMHSNKNFKKGGDIMQVGDYVVKPSCIREENCLKNFLKMNNFKYADYFENNPINREYLIVINVIRRTYFEIDRYYIAGQEILSEKEFLEKINYEKYSIYKKLFSDDDKLVYEGYTILDKPFGLGVAYYSNGNKYREGIFGRRGMIEGKEFYSNGKIKFEGILKYPGYGPIYPTMGNLYNEDGELIFSGKFEVKKGGVGFPMVKYPKYYRFNEKDRPEIEYL